MNSQKKGATSKKTLDGAGHSAPGTQAGYGVPDPKAVAGGVKKSGSPGSPARSQSHISLRAFQNELAVRIATRSEVPEEASQLGIFAGGRRWLCQLQGINEILFPTPITSVPLTKPWFLGLTNVRGNLHSVIDFSQFLGEPPITVDENTRMILFNQAGSSALNLALLVQEVYGLRTLKGFAPTGTAPEEFAWCTQNWADVEGNRWSELDLVELTRDPLFQYIGRQQTK